MRVFIVGAGEVGFNTAQMLSKEGHEVTVVEQNEDLVSRASEQLDALVLHGNGASPKMLAEVGAHRSELLIAVTDSDEVNITACLVAKAQGVRQTVARIRNPDYYDSKEPFARDVLGIDFVIHTERAAAEEIRDALRVPGSVNVETFAEDNIEVAEVVLKEDSPVAGKAVRELDLPRGSLLVGVVRENKTIIPRGDTDLRVGDHVFLISERQRINEVVRGVSTDTEKVESVMIFGGGRIGLRLALILEEEGISVKVVEKDEERAQYVASRLRKGLVLYDEGMSRDFLLQERVDRAGAFVAATGDDRANLLAVMYAKQLGGARGGHRHLAAPHNRRRHPALRPQGRGGGRGRAGERRRDDRVARPGEVSGGGPAARRGGFPSWGHRRRGDAGREGDHTDRPGRLAEWGRRRGVYRGHGRGRGRAPLCTLG
jgi:trk system potassium uptake protein TrkA